jgi:hypothetical protein
MILWVWSLCCGGYCCVLRLILQVDDGWNEFPGEVWRGLSEVSSHIGANLDLFYVINLSLTLTVSFKTRQVIFTSTALPPLALNIDIHTLFIAAEFYKRITPLCKVCQVEEKIEGRDIACLGTALDTDGILSSVILVSLSPSSSSL